MKYNYTPEDFYLAADMPVRFRDLDPLNHVNNAVYNSYFEEARVKFIHAIPEFSKSMAEGHSFVLVNINLNYIKPVVYGEKIIVCSSVKEFGNSSISGIQAIFSKEESELKAVAETTGVWFNLKNQRPARLPDISNREQYLFDKNYG